VTAGAGPDGRDSSKSRGLFSLLKAPVWIFAQVTGPRAEAVLIPEGPWSRPAVCGYGDGVTGRSVLPPDQYVASLPRKRMAATAFFRDDQGRVLLVNPVYKEPWDLPGGVVEAEESPHAACRREVAEELGLDRPPGPVLAVDWVPSRPERPEGLIVVYDGGVLSDAEVKEIVLADGELAGFAFVPGNEVAGLVTPLLARRVASCLDAVAAGAVAALENGSPTA